MCELDKKHLQQFLAKCLESDSIADIDPSFFDMSYVAQSVIHLRFYIDLPQSFSCVDPSLATSELLNTESRRHISNEFKCMKWLLPKSTKLGDMFTPEIQKSTPAFKGDCQCCPHWASKGYYFAICKNKDSHCR